jgi:hypothetical protein
MDVCLVQCCLLCLSLIQRSRTECGVSECDREASIMRGPWPIGGCCAIGGGLVGWLVGCLVGCLVS